MLEEAEAGDPKAESEQSTTLVDRENISKERATEILKKLLHLSSVEILKTIQKIDYLSASEVYS